MEYIEKDLAIRMIAEQYRLFKGKDGSYPHDNGDEGDARAIAQIDACIDILEGMPTININQ